MITAYEARQLAIVGDSKIEAIMEKLDKEITHRAGLGQNEYVAYEHVPWNSHRTQFYQIPEVTPIQAKIIQRLKDFGYDAEMDWDEKRYVPPGLADDDGHGPEHQNYVLRIRW